MKKIFRHIVVASLVCFSISCASTKPQQVDNRPRFHEAAAASVVLQFNSWDYIFMTHPDYRENGFQHQLKREDLGQAFSRVGVRHDLAVVVLGWNYDNMQLAKLVDEWKTVLSANGFHRVVCVRANGGSDVDGSIVLDDAQLPSGQPTTQAKL